MLIPLGQSAEGKKSTFLFWPKNIKFNIFFATVRTQPIRISSDWKGCMLIFFKSSCISIIYEVEKIFNHSLKKLWISTFPLPRSVGKWIISTFLSEFRYEKFKMLVLLYNIQGPWRRTSPVSIVDLSLFTSRSSMYLSSVKKGGCAHRSV
jgi:hypothetical protein